MLHTWRIKRYNMTRAKDISKIITDANLSGTLDVTGAFTSQGIDDNATSTAITVDASQNVMIGTTSHDGNGMKLQVEHSSSSTDGRVQAHGFSCRDNFGSVSNLGNGIASTASNTLVFATNSTEAMRIDSNGNVGIGGNPTNASDHKSLALFGASGTGAGFIEFNDTSGNADGAIFVDNGHLLINADYDNTVASSTIRFRIDGSSEKMRINSSGNVLIGTTSYSAGGNGKMIEGNGQVFLSRSTTGQAGQLVFQNPNGSVGQVVTSGTSTSYNTSSDHRLKENVTADWDATTRLKQLNPVRFNFIADADTTVDGFLAHEVQTVVPEAIGGEKDAVDKDGKIIPQGIDQSKLVPLLVKTIQELEARIVALENAE